MSVSNILTELIMCYVSAHVFFSIYFLKNLNFIFYN